MKMEIHPIGTVESDFKTPEELHFACKKGRFAGTKSNIVLLEKFSDALKGLERFSHVWIIYYLHKALREEITTYPGPKSIKNLPPVGVFASRSQYRPNHLALRLTELVKIKGRKITVKGLDAVDRTPVIDIKPYIPFFDRTENEKIAEWYEWTGGMEAALSAKERR